MPRLILEKFLNFAFSIRLVRIAKIRQSVRRTKPGVKVIERMDNCKSGRGRIDRKRISLLGMGLIFSALIVWPYLKWFENPSLYDDDFLRVGSLRRTALGDALFRPFNEHMAPLFETISWLCWQASGQFVPNLPLSFQISSYLAFGLTLMMLGIVARSELGSWPATAVGLAVFGLSAVSAETVLWFSASSFEWSAAATLCAWFFAIRAARSEGPGATFRWLVLTALASLAAPAFSAIGVLAGPVAALRLFADSRPLHSTVVRWARPLAPLSGLLTYFVICQSFGYGKIVSTSVRNHLDLAAAAWATVEAPTAVLLPGLFGQSPLARSFPRLGFALLTTLALGGFLIQAARSPVRSMILTALVLIFGGYAATYATRARTGDLSIFEVQRYHLFPQVGLSLLMAAGLDGILRRRERREFTGVLIPILLTLLLAIAQYPRMQAATDRNFRFAEQPRALAAMLSLEATCKEKGITLVQAIRAIDPVQAPWFPRPTTIHPLFHLFANDVEAARVADAEVRSILLSSLSIDDREAIFGGLDASLYQILSWAEIVNRVRIGTRLVGQNRVVRIGSEQYRAGGPGSWLEFEVNPELDSPRALILPDLKTCRDVELRWTLGDGTWSHFRSVRWSPSAFGSDRPGGVDLDRLPHWRAESGRRIRLIFHEWGPISVGTPFFVR